MERTFFAGVVTQLSNEHYQFLLDVQSRMSRVIKPVILIFLSGSSFFSYLVRL